tara:strand:+ start:1898 stop:2374 length:477 start_codon:yes stop_codon:yes gene_type:complete
MYYKKQEYNRDRAEELLKEFQGLTNFNIKDSSRKEPAPAYRSLLYHLLKVKLGLNDRSISDFLESKGLKKDRSSVYHSLNKFKQYLKDFKEIEEHYNYFFDSKPKISNLIDDDLSKTIRKIKSAGDRLELLELVKLRIKSWEWKKSQKVTKAKVYEGC